MCFRHITAYIKNTFSPFFWFYNFMDIKYAIFILIQIYSQAKQNTLTISGL